MEIATKFVDVYHSLINLSIIDFSRIKDLIDDIQDIIETKSINPRSYCPHCGSTKLKKNGKSATDIQKYKCISCKKNFNQHTKTPFAHSKKFANHLPLIINSLLSKDSIRRSASIMDVDKVTAYSWRIKILDIIDKFDKSFTLKDKVQTDETFYPINFKGTKPSYMPRISKKRGAATTNNNELICIPTAIDTSKKILMKVAGVNSINCKVLENVLSDKIEDKTIIIADGAYPYTSFCKRHNLERHIVNSKTYKSKEGTDINTINGLHSEFKIFMASFKGVSVKHIRSYIAWFRLKKYLVNNSIENPIDFIEEIIRKAKKVKIKFYDCFKKKPAVSINKVYGRRRKK